MNNEKPNKSNSPVKKWATIAVIICLALAIVFLFVDKDIGKRSLDAYGSYYTLEDARQSEDICEHYDSPDYLFTVKEDGVNFITDLIIKDDNLVVSVFCLLGKTPSQRYVPAWSVCDLQRYIETYSDLSHWTSYKNTRFQRPFYVEWCIVKRADVTGDEPYTRFDFDYKGDSYSLFCKVQNEKPKAK